MGSRRRPGKVLTLKQCPRMALVRPLVDLTRGTLTIIAPDGAGVAPLELAIPGLFRRGRLPSCSADSAIDAMDSAAMPAPTAVAAVADASATAAVTATAAPGGVGVGGHSGGSVRLDAGLTLERVQVCGDTVCSDLVRLAGCVCVLGCVGDQGPAQGDVGAGDWHRVTRCCLTLDTAGLRCAGGRVPRFSG
jgi:hypothetical protein